MFNPSTFIDTFQGTKRSFTDQYVKDAVLNKACHSYIDAQTEFAKTLVKNYLDISTHVAESANAIFFPKEEKVSKAKVTVVDKNTTA